MRYFGGLKPGSVQTYQHGATVLWGVTIGAWGILKRCKLLFTTSLIHEGPLPVLKHIKDKGLELEPHGWQWETLTVVSNCGDSFVSKMDGKGRVLGDLVEKGNSKKVVGNICLVEEEMPPCRISLRGKMRGQLAVLGYDQLLVGGSTTKNTH